MKRGTIEHPKMAMLAEALGIPHLHAVGVMEALALHRKVRAAWQHWQVAILSQTES